MILDPFKVLFLVFLRELRGDPERLGFIFIHPKLHEPVTGQLTNDY